ncbi:MAG: hypothetical protein QM733_20565 [Ilumatobacteraceae bacterium]
MSEDQSDAERDNQLPVPNPFAGLFENSDLTRLSESMRQLAKISVPKLDIPLPQYDFSSLLGGVAKFNERFVERIRPTMEAFNKLYRDQIADLLANFAKTIRRTYPPNWQDDDVHFPSNLETLLLDEGLPLAWVPPAAVLKKLFAAESATERRKVLSQSRKSIIAASMEELQQIEDPRLREHVKFAMEAAEALRDGKWRASQALSANLLDSILRRSFTEASRIELTNQRNRIDWKKYPVRSALVWGAIWGAHGEYWPSNGDPIPRQYTRHATAHGVSQRQYTRLNAVIALMHVVGLLRLIEVDVLPPKRRRVAKVPEE